MRASAPLSTAALNKRGLLLLLVQHPLRKYKDAFELVSRQSAAAKISLRLPNMTAIRLADALKVLCEKLPWERESMRRVKRIHVTRKTIMKHCDINSKEDILVTSWKELEAERLRVFSASRATPTLKRKKKITRLGSGPGLSRKMLIEVEVVDGQQLPKKVAIAGLLDWPEVKRARVVRDDGASVDEAALTNRQQAHELDALRSQLARSQAQFAQAQARIVELERDAAVARPAEIAVPTGDCGSINDC